MLIRNLCPVQKRRERKKKKFQGIVRVRIDDLVFAPDDTPYNFNVDNKKVDQLIDIFKTEGCDRTSPQNYIVGEISNEDLLIAVGLSGLTLENLWDGGELRILNLPPRTYIRCPKAGVGPRPSMISTASVAGGLLSYMRVRTSLLL
jgi:hypothetical protein